MIQNVKLIRFTVMVTLLLMSSLAFPDIHASHGGGSGGGGGCGGSCIPPTLGTDSNGRVIVQEGLSINSILFDVDYYSQSIPTQVLSKGEQATVKLKIFDNEGPTTVTHAELHFAPYDELVSGILIEKSVAALVWDGRDGDEVIGIIDDEYSLQNITIEANDEDNFKIISFKFEPVTELETSSLMIVMWDESRNVVKNYFVDAIKVVDPTISSLSQYEGDGDVVPSWIKISAGWWADEKISDSDFFGAIEFMIQTNILSFETTNNEKSNPANDEIPYWIKNTAKWWSDGLIPEGDFVKSIQFLINNGVISI